MNKYGDDDDDDDEGISGIERLELQINAGVRPILDDVDDLRIFLGSNNVTCPTTKAETRLRCGEVALIPLQLICKVNINNNYNDDFIIVTLTIIFPKTGYPNDSPLDIILSNDNKNNNNDDTILNILKEFCKQKNDKDDFYPRARAVLEKMKQLYYDAYFTNTTDDDNNDNDNEIDNDNNDIECNHVNQYATCMLCRYHIFDMIEIEMHEPSNKGFKRGSSPFTSCTSYFLKDSKEWMTGLTENNGKILCPNSKCNAKLGQWCWTGSQCSCGLWITPAFQINKNKIDIKVERNDI